MNNIDVLDNEVNINGHLLKFPLSYEEIKAELGEAREDTDGRHIFYIYDDLGISFEGSVYFLGFFKKEKAYVDNAHDIGEINIVVTEENRYDNPMPKKLFKGSLTFFGKQEDQRWFNKFMGAYQASFTNEEGESEYSHIGAYISGNDEDPHYDGEILLKDVSLSFKPKRPKSNENYNLVVPDEPCLVFDNFNFKLAVINELMYEQEVLKPYFDIYDYKTFKKASWNLDTEKNVRAAVSFFKELMIPVRLADKITEIYMDGGDDIYMNIAPAWDGEDDRFTITKLSEAELKQFKNLKKMRVFNTDLSKLEKVCQGLGIEIETI